MKARYGSPELIVGKDITLEQIPDFLAQALVGRFCGKIVTKASLQQWIALNWSNLLGYEPTFYSLPRGWFLIKLQSMEDNCKLLKHNWNWGPSGLILKNWTIDFNAYKEPHNIQKV